MKKLCLILFFLPVFSLAQRPELVVKTGIRNVAMMVAISPDNKLGLSVDDYEEMVLWELATGRQLKTYPNIVAADFGTDNKSIEVVTNEYRFRTIDYYGNTISESPLKATANQRSNRITYSYYRNSGLFLDNGVFFSKEKGYLCRIVPEHYTVEQHFSEKLSLISIPYQSTVQLCKVPSGEISKVIKFDLAQKSIDYPEIRFTQFSPDGKYLLAGNTFSLEIIEIESGKSVYTTKKTNAQQELDKSSSFINNASFSPDSKNLLILGQSKILMVDLRTKIETWNIANTDIKSPSTYESIRGFVRFSEDGSRTIVGYKNKFYVLNVSNGNIISKLMGVTQAFTRYHQLRESNNALYLEMFNNMINWNLASGAVKSTTPVRTPTNPYSVQITGNGSRYYRFWQEIAQSSNAITELESEGGVSNQEADCLSLSYDDKYLLHIGQYNFSSDINKGRLYVADLNTKKILWKKNQFDAAVFANTSNTIAAANTMVVPNKSGYSSIQLFEGATGNLIKTFTIPAESQEAYGMVFSPKDTYLTLSPYNMNGNLYSYDCQYLIETSTGKLTQISKILPNGKHFKFQGFTPDEKYMIVTVKYRPHEEVFFYDIRQQKWDLTKTVPVNEKNSINSISVTKDNRFMFTNTQEYNVKLWDLGSKRLLATLYPMPSSGDWAIVMPDGRFDASPAAQKDIYFVKGINTFPLEILYETYYAPKLLPRLLAGEQFAPIDTDFDNLKKAPVARITYEQKTRNLFVEDDGLPTYNNTTGLAQITVNATSENDKIDEIRLFHNGKIVNLATRGLFVTDDATSTDSKKYEIKLMPGQNSFRAVALNSQRTESKPDEIVVNYQATEKPAPNQIKNTTVGNGIIDDIDKNATLYLVVVGINKYKNEKMSLNYALADATAFKDEIEKDTKTVLADIKTFFVTDNSADKKGIMEAFADVQKLSKPRDVFVFYYAGHGVISKTNEFYLVPNDVTDLKNVSESLVQNGIPAKMLQQYAIDIQAQKQLFILDACQSAGAFESLLTTDAQKQKSIAVVARSTGTHWMAASGAQQYANEFASLGHGVFTYVMLQALKGAAENNKMITVNGLKNYLQNEVPELMKKYSGNLQYPASYGFGNDFPVEKIDK